MSPPVTASKRADVASRGTDAQRPLPKRKDYEGVSCKPMGVSSGPKDAPRTLRLRCKLDTLVDQAEMQVRRFAVRGLGLAEKIARPIGMGGFHRRIPGIRDWRTPTPIVAPIFIVGSPRSGTSILGKVLGHQGDVVYLSEARPVWFAAFPELDNSWWHWRDGEPQGRIFLDETNLCEQTKAKLEKAFGWNMRLAGRDRLMEKMPINLFRVRWLRAMWPDATFIHVIRDPFATTSSKVASWPIIDEERFPGIALRRKMFGDLFPELAPILATIKTSYEWYLFEWRMYVQEGERLKRMFPHSYLILRLEDLQGNAEEALMRICEFVRLRFTNRLQRAYRTMLSPRVRMAKSQVEPARRDELIGDTACRWGYDT